MLLLLMFVAYCFADSSDLEQNAGGPVDQACLACLCEGASQCVPTTGCQADICGLFKITWAYWSDAGKHVLPLDDASVDGAWQRCVKDPYCATQTVQGYMSRFRQDCNRDGKIDCYDYASIHVLGGYGCTSDTPWNHEFKTRFDACTNLIKK